MNIGMNISAPNASKMMEDLIQNPERELVTIKRLAMLMDAGEKTIRDWILDGKIPYVKLPTGGIRFHLPTVREWYRRGMVSSVRQ
jgi:excisionase family DNA binding protein